MTNTAKSRLRSRGPSIADVAKLAGVSDQTVSRVSNGSARVLPETRERVVQAMNELGYSPNTAARALRRGRFSTIGIITQRFDRTGENLSAAAVIKKAEELDYATTLVQVSSPAEDDLSRATSRLTHHSIDGLIILRVDTASAQSLSLPPHLPVVVSDYQLHDAYPSVITDHVMGSREVVEHLLSLGHRNVFHVAGPKDSSPAVYRQEAWAERLQLEGITPQPVWQGDWTAKSGYEAGKHIANNPDITAVYCSNDEMAFGLMRALQEKGVRVPEDVSVVGFDAIELSEYSYPPLTTVVQDYEAIGQELVKLLVAQINGENMAPGTQVIIPSSLIIRGSTAAPTRR